MSDIPREAVEALRAQVQAAVTRARKASYGHSDATWARLDGMANQAQAMVSDLDALLAEHDTPAPEAATEVRATHHVHRGAESIPCWCAAAFDHLIGQEIAAPAPAVPADDEDAHAAFYEEHYSDWTVHALPLMVYVPMKDSSRDDALTLVQETLDEGSWDIRVALAPSPAPADGARDAGRLSEDEQGALHRAAQWHWEQRLERITAVAESILRDRLAKVEAERDEAREAAKLHEHGYCEHSIEHNKRLSQRLKSAEAEVTSLRDQVAAVEEAVSGHPECDKYADDNAITCGWKRAVTSVHRALTDPGETLRARDERVWAERAGTERVEWGVDWGNGSAVEVCEGSKEWAEDRAGARPERTLLTRTVTDFAPVVGEWVEAGDEDDAEVNYLCAGCGDWVAKDPDHNGYPCTFTARGPA